MLLCSVYVDRSKAIDLDGGYDMCGIVGYVGDGKAAEFLLAGLSRLEYRGYDSSGIAVYDGEIIRVKKSVGRLAELKAKLKGKKTAFRSSYSIWIPSET